MLRITRQVKITQAVRFLTVETAKTATPKPTIYLPMSKPPILLPPLQSDIQSTSIHSSSIKW